LRLSRILDTELCPTEGAREPARTIVCEISRKTEERSSWEEYCDQWVEWQSVCTAATQSKQARKCCCRVRLEASQLLADQAAAAAKIRQATLSAPSVQRCAGDSKYELLGQETSRLGIESAHYPIRTRRRETTGTYDWQRRCLRAHSIPHSRVQGVQ
jgi:hypothetical protein